MAYMHKATFEILQDGFADEAATVPLRESGDWFEVDDLIALPIQTLNRKGYLTEFCCAAHPFTTVSRLITPSEEICNALLTGLSGKMTQISETDLLYKEIMCRSYIKFKSSHSFPSLPQGFTKGGTVLECNYDFNGVYEYIRDNVDAMERLYQWTLGLPELGG